MSPSLDALTSHDLEGALPDNTRHRNETPESPSGAMDDVDENAGLTEVAMPRPAQPDDPQHDHLEQALTSKLDGQGYTQSDDENLTELRVPSRAASGSGHGNESNRRYNTESPSTVERKEDIDGENHRVRFPVTEFYVVGHLIFFAILGTLSRLGVEAINTYSGAPVVSSVLWANVGGSLIFGFLVEDRRLFKEEWGKHLDRWSFKPLGDDEQNESTLTEVARKHLKVKKTLPLYIGLSTGFCGSFTSFSTFLRDAFLGLSGQLWILARSAAQSPGDGGHDFEAVIGIIVIHVACSLSALKFGAHLALATQGVVPTLPFRFVRKYLDPGIAFLGLGCWLGAVFLAVWPPRDAWRDQVLFSLVFAPVGCLFRFCLARHLNQVLPSFPLGTFLANVSGTAALGVCFIVQHSGHRSVLSCQILEGIMDGFSGCATTVSTWVGELETLERKHAYIYGISSIGTGLAFLVVIIGSLLWSVGFRDPTCHV